MSRARVLVVFAGAALGLGASALGQTTVDQGRAYAADLTADASGRTSTLAQAAAGPRVYGILQFRYLINSRDDVGGEEEDTAVGFQTRTTELGVDGEVGEDWAYNVRMNFDFLEDSGTAFLEWAYMDYSADENWDIRFGQFETNVVREENVENFHALAVEPSVMNAFFTQGTSQGLQGMYTGENVRFYLGFTDGSNSANTDFISMSEADWSVNGRVEFKGDGDWSQFDDFTSPKGSTFAWMGGIAGEIESGGDTFATADEDYWLLTGDVGLEGNGWNAFGALVYDNYDPEGGTDLSNWGFNVQGGIYLSDTIELFGRWGMLFPDDDISDDDEFNEITVGLNCYMIGAGNHTAKASVDVSYFPDGTGVAPASTAIGLLPEDDEQWLLRFQMQLLF
jgi:hypothetical protein